MTLEELKMSDLEYDSLFPKLVEIRRKKISQLEAADALGITPQTLSRIECGKHRSMYVFNVYMDSFGGDLE